MSGETRAAIDWSRLFAGRTHDVGDGLAGILSLADVTDLISFAGGFPDPQTFPGMELAEILGELLRQGEQLALQYAPVPGLPGLREYLASRLESLEGRRPRDAELIVTSGAVEALSLIGRSFLDSGDLAVVEAPTYVGAIQSLRGLEAQILAVTIDEDGLDVEELGVRLSQGSIPKLLYTIPDHQNPSGMSMSEERRRALVGLARRFGFLVVEDVAYREIHYEGDLLPSLWSMAPDLVVQIGTFSKTFFPGVRLGWAAGPAPVVEQMLVAKQTSDQCAGALGQRLLEEFGRRGLLDPHVARMRSFYRRRRDLLLDALDRHMGEDASWSTPRGGFFNWVTTQSDIDTLELVPKAREHKIAYVPGAVFFPDGRGRTSLRLAFSRVEEEDIDEGIHRLAALLREAGS